MSFAQAMVVPTLLTVGLGSLLLARQLPVAGALYAQAPSAEAQASGEAGSSAASGTLGAPNRARAVAGAAGARAELANGVGVSAGPGGVAVSGAAALARNDRNASGAVLGTGSPEFGGRGPDGTVIRAITEAELAMKAVEQSGREDPFMSLLPPDPGTIVPPQVDFGPLAAPPAPLATTPPGAHAASASGGGHTRPLGGRHPHPEA
jgi:hypothetical protein